MDTTPKKLYIILAIIVVVAALGFILWNQRTTPGPKTENQKQEAKLEIAPLITTHATTTYTTVDMSYPRSTQSEYPEMFEFIQKTRNDFDHDFGNPTEDTIQHDPWLQRGDRFNFFMTTEIATSSKTVSYIISVYQYTGGAHGGTSVTSFTYDANKKLVTPERLFTGPYLEKVSAKSRQYFYTNLDYGQKEMIDAGTQPTAENFSTWYITDSAVTFIFGQYQVGPYAIGIQKYALPKQEISDILSPEFK